MRHSYEVRQARLEETDAVREFLRCHWKKGHVLAQDHELFSYEHHFQNRLNYAVAASAETAELAGVCGFIKNAYFYDGADAWGVTWKVRERTGDPCLGIKLIKYLADEMGFRSFSGCGANVKTLPIYDCLGYVTGALRHHYILNAEMDDYRIAVVSERFCRRPVTGEARLIEFSSFEDLLRVFQVEQYRSRVPFKDAWYLQRRYFQHPRYVYRVYGIERASEIASILVLRIVDCCQSRAMRVVDYIGRDEDLGMIGESLRHLMVSECCEYLDIYEYGLSNDILAKAGFCQRMPADPNVIPNYFEPFVQKNVDIHFFTTWSGPIHIFKGDGDQDRPNR